MNERTLSIGIMGVGTVGGALARYFQEQGREPLLYDPGKSTGSLEDIQRADIVFLCVPTPFREGIGCNVSALEKACASLQGKKIVVVKSTVSPGTTAKLQERYPSHVFLYNPEFLREERAFEDMVRPDRQLVGTTLRSLHLGEQIMRILPRAPFEKIVKAEEAEMAKYFGNAFLALKVAFANEMYGLCKKLGIDYEAVRLCVQADPRIGPSHLDVFHGGYRGYGGKCLPKDVKSLLRFAQDNGEALSLLKAAQLLNQKLMEEQGIENSEDISKRVV